MYAILLSSAVALLILISGLSLDWWGWVWGIVMAVLAFLGTWILIGLQIRKRLAPGMVQVQKLAEARMLPQAIEACRTMLPLGRWLPMLTGQIYAQMGGLAFANGDRRLAREYFSKATRRAPDAQMLYGSMLYQDGDKERGLQVLQLACAVHRKHTLLHHVRAWLLNKEGRTKEAMACLASHLDKAKDNEVSQDSLLRLQNGRKLNMQRFGQEWWILGFERPPAAIGQMQTGRKGFRQPPKRRGR